MMAWPVAALEGPPSRFQFLINVNQLIFRFETHFVLNIFRILGAVALVLCSVSLDQPVPLLTGGLAAALAFNLLRCGYGADGADQMFVIVLTGLTVASTFPPDSLGVWFGLWFIAAQLTLSYTVSGWAKVLGPRWRDGSGLAGVFSTYGYGFRAISRLFNAYPLMSFTVSWLVIVWEATFGLAWFLPPGGMIFYLTLGVLFHLGVGLVMGLNNFIFAFLAPYPIVWLCMITMKN